MAYSPSEKYPGAVDTDPNYQGGKFRDNNPSTTNNGSPLKAIDRNELLARDEAIMNDAGFEYNGIADTPQDSQMFRAYKASLGNGANLLSNHNFLIKTPDNTLDRPDATPRTYPAGYQIFSGVFANETTGITNLTYVDGRVSFSGGDFYMPVANAGAIARLTTAQLVASVADFDGKPRSRGVSFALVGNEYHVTVGVDALEDVSANSTPLGSVKFEQGRVATGHSVQGSSSFKEFPSLFTDGTYTEVNVIGVSVGDSVAVEDYAPGNGSGVLFFKVVEGGTGVHDGGKYIDLPSSDLQLVQNLPKIINAKCFGLKGNYTDDDLPQLINLWNYAPGGSSILYPAGHYKLDGGAVHPLKQLHHHGVGRSPTFIPAANNIRGTSFYFPTFSGVNKGGIYMPPPSGSDFCRFSSFNDITLFGDGTNDDNGNVTCLKINNLGTHLNRVDSRYGAVGVENNYSVGALWQDVKLFGAVYGVNHVYDAATPFGTETNSVVTENVFKIIQVATSKTNTASVGWNQDATCQYANNFHGGSFDCEQCYTGARFEGRIASKDHDGIQVFGSAAFQSVGNIIDGAWFEVNTDNNVVLAWDPGQPEPSLIPRGLYQDSEKIFTAEDSQITLTTPTGDRPLKLGATKDAAQGVTGGWGTPFTANQYLLHGKETNAPVLRSIINESISKKLGNRASIDEKGGYSWSYAKDDVPLVGATVNIANFDLSTSPFKSVMIEFAIEAVSVTGVRYSHVGTILADNDNDSITSSLLQGSSFFRPGGAPSLSLQAIRVASNTFGLFFFKDSTVTEVINATVSIKCTIGAGSDGNRQSILTTFGV